MPIPISGLSPGPTADVARKVDEGGDKDGSVSAEELSSTRARVDAGESGWDNDSRSRLDELARLLGTPPAIAPLEAPEPSCVAGDLGRLNDTQRTALTAVAERAKRLSQTAHGALVQIAKRLGFTEANLTTCLEYIRTKAPLTVNFFPDKRLADGARHLADAFVVDPVYRNQFETRITGGSATAYPGGSRDVWERTIFNGAYHTHDLVPQERPKYGAMNADNNPCGGASSYGSSYFVLKDETRVRCTFTPTNSSSCNADSVGTAEDFEHVLTAKPDNQLTAIMNAALGRGTPPTGSTYPYTEMQVHGPLELDKDVATVVIHTQCRGTPYEAKLRDLAARNHLAIAWTDGTKIIPDGPTA